MPIGQMRELRLWRPVGKAVAGWGSDPGVGAPGLPALRAPGHAFRASLASNSGFEIEAPFPSTLTVSSFLLKPCVVSCPFVPGNPLFKI